MADKLLRSIKFPTLPDRYVIGDPTLTEEGAAAEAKAVGEALATKADTKGRYEDLIVGGAEQLMADEYEIDKEPYLFRPTGGSADVGNREYLDKIVGGTVAWNQLVGESATSVTVQSGHKYIAKIGGAWSVAASSGSAISVTGGTDMVIDLTALFNPTIADYIYSLEQATAGAGVAWFRQYFPKSYYPYDPGTLRSVEGVSAHETVGFNQWDEEWESGSYNYSTGEKTVNVNTIRSKNLIPCLPNTNYYFRANLPTNVFYVTYYDVNKNFVSADISGMQNAVKTTPSNASYMAFWVGNASNPQTTYNHDICINLSDPTRNGEYEAYQKHTYPLDSSLTLRGVPKLVDGKLAFDGDAYQPSGEVQRRYELVDLGTLTWSKNGDENVYYATLRNGKNANDINAITDASYTYIPKTQTGTDKIFKIISTSTAPTAYFRNDSTSTVADFVNTINGKNIVYELATPATETADGYDHYQICDPSGTEEFVTDSIVPVGHETRYPHDLKKKIETAPDSPSTDGTYLMKRSGGKNAYMALPSTPSANGAYVLTVTVSGGSASYSWTAKE